MPTETPPYAIHWFRRDLRVAGNPALEFCYKEFNTRVLGFFCFDAKFLSRPDFSVDRFAFFLKTMQALQQELREIGGDLLVLDLSPLEAFPALFEKLALSGIPLPSLISYCRDYEPFARKRDQDFEALVIRPYGIRLHTERDHLLLEPNELTKHDSDKQSFYQVYTPFAKRWYSLFESKLIQPRIRHQTKALAYLEKRLNSRETQQIFSLSWAKLFRNNLGFEDKLDLYLKKNLAITRLILPEAGSLAAYKCLKEFSSKVSNYQETRDFPDKPGTSKLSIYLKNGSITSSIIIAHLKLKADEFPAKTGENTYLKELVWREFYYHILYHRPDVEQQAFLEKYRNLTWENQSTYFEAWKNGLTGYPIVDAAMRQLKETGWMHNRARMIVASFLTKDLLINWQEGERYFMQTLLDGDLAPNNGGWQWAASTGCDPQPYFRIFNPYLQSKKFDPSASYIKKWVPELKKVDPKLIHSSELSQQKLSYPKPIVCHDEQRFKALELYRQI